MFNERIEERIAIQQQISKIAQNRRYWQKMACQRGLNEKQWGYFMQRTMWYKTQEDILWAQYLEMTMP